MLLFVCLLQLCQVFASNRKSDEKFCEESNTSIHSLQVAVRESELVLPSVEDLTAVVKVKNALGLKECPCAVVHA